ncbi:MULTISPECIES: multidrug efflux SMR transporter [Paraburkholderia]|uniref:DMT family transporter n=1 Tax=Paraburkholderia TaxID=1822464 RepID=UPI002253782F|nr:MULTISPECIES: multidrug efflux SMR transporter [Paraburkholderia]MCX4164243.1 multidrug efflux SMR transporter [Paraburkholderia megapolitana]MDN7159737.1 multidrug efflux SMR transporter [Paraburkholderia sp. CHISQ3]MDQ6496784.1 multidrug efflux SMR transporter [Paraburkholderia megapolitana]
MLTTQIAWALLAASVAAESLGTAALNLSSGFTRLLPSILTVACYATAVWLMALATKRIEMGMAYAAWAGSSAALTAAIGIIWFGEALSLVKAIGIGTAICGIVLLNLSGNGS